MSITKTVLLSFLLLFIISSPILAYSQEEANADTLAKIPTSYFESITAKAGRMEASLDKKTSKTLRQFQRQEEKIRRRLGKTDSLKAKALLSNAQQQYAGLEQRLQNAGSLKQYIPSLDTINTSLKFLEQNPQLLAATKGAKEKLSAAMGQLGGMEGKFQQAEELKNFLNERRQYLKEQLGHLSFAKELKQLNKQAYYYSAQLSEYKSMLKDHKKATRKGLELLSKTKLFKSFMRKNSQLASLFRLPADPNDPSAAISLVGLQTRAQVNNLIQQQIASGGPGAMQQVQQNMQDAQSQLNVLKDKIIKAGGGSSGDASMPEGFKPNNQRVKSFLKRLEFGTNIQSQKASGFFPTTSDIGVSLGYKLNDKSIIGIGASYKLGWGRDIRHVRISHQGVGLRSFAEVKLKGSFWLIGGYEMNYRSEFRQVEELKDLSAWQQSCLVGVSKVISLRTKLLKKTKMQLMWDFLSSKQAPRTQAVVFRIGYSF